MITKLFLQGRLAHALTDAEHDAIEGAIDEVIEVGPRTRLVSRGEKVDRSFYLVDGFMIRYLEGRDGKRQSVGMQVPGDWVDLHSFPMKRLDHDVWSLNSARLAIFRHSELDKLVAQHPRLARIMWFATLLDAAMHREWLFRLGRLNAEGRVAHLVCELAHRLSFIGRFDGRHLAVPLTQADFAEACGISQIHANRTFRILREGGLIENREAREGLDLLDIPALRKLGEFSPDYLYGDGELHLDHPFQDK